MHCILLGTGGMMPLPHRLLCSLAVRLNGRTYLFDAGEGTQLGWKKVRLGMRGFRLLAVSHLHADHCLGIPGLMMLRAQMDDPDPLTILGPPGIEEFVRQNQKIMEFHINYAVRFREWSESTDELAYQDDQARIFWHPLSHTRLCLGYRLEELERPGKFSPERAKALRIPQGPLWGRLQKGENITAENGRSITPDKVMGPPRRGRQIAYVVDTRTTKNIYTLCREVDMAFMEGMFLPEDADHAEAKGHLTVTEAARIADRAGASRAVLIHISPRYDQAQLNALEEAARRRFNRIQVGRDGDVFTIPLEE